ncbi:MAG: flagellar hook-associated protein FlgK [Thermodesulfovibrionales bacterium]|nr:flagellar hook-associated protein FlgK [Thermodesulfovibrionales bacterium]
MSIFGLFDIGKSALFSSQLGLYVTGHNIANLNTPGFNRQEIILETSSPVFTDGGFLGRGVRVAGIKRHFDRFIYNQLFIQEQRLGMSRILSNTMSRIETTFNDIKNLGLSGALQEFFNAWQEVVTSPESLPARNLLISKAQTFLNVAKEMEGSVKDILKEIEVSIGVSIDRINSLISKIGELNGKILQVESGLSHRANDLRDQREGLLRELSGLINVSYYEEDNGSITVTHGTFPLVEREKAYRISSAISTDGKRRIYVSGQDITETIISGELGGLLSSRSDIERYQLSGFRRLIASIIKEINLQHRQGYGLDGSTGNNFFTPLSLHIDNYTKNAAATANISDITQLTLDEYEISFDSTNYYVRSLQTGSLITSGPYVSGNTISFEGIDISISGAVLHDERIVISPLKNILTDAKITVDALKIAVSSSSSSLPSDNINGLYILNIFQTPLSSLGGATFIDYYRELVSTTATLSRTAQDSMRFEQNLMDEIIKQREALSGVSLDEEAVNLIKFQRAFEAGAKVIKVADELLETIINL